MEDGIDIVMGLYQRLQTDLAGAAQQGLVGANVHLDFALAGLMPLLSGFRCVDIGTLDRIDALLDALPVAVHSIHHCLRLQSSRRAWSASLYPIRCGLTRS